MSDGPNGSPDLLTRTAPARRVSPRLRPPSLDPYDRYQRRRRVVRRLLWGLLALVVVVVAIAVALFAATESLGNNVKRVYDVFTPLQQSARPAPTGQLTFLLIGRDTGVTPAPADTYMLATADQSRTTSSIVAVPPTTQVTMPGHGVQPLDAAQGLGGPALQVASVEALTNVRVDHYAIIDFGQIGAAVDQLGGIDIGIAQATSAAGFAFAQGTNHLDGAQVLAYLRQGDLARGDQDRVQRQQAVMRGLLYRVMATGPGGPIGIYNLIADVAGAVSVDDTLTNNDLRGLGIELRGMRPAESIFLTAPLAAAADPGGPIHLDDARAAQLWQAVRTDSVGLYGQQNPTDVLGGWAP